MAFATHDEIIRLSIENPDDPVLRALANAPVDDEPTTEEDLRAIAEADASLAAGEPTYTTEELLRELGLTSRL
jgi:hypothetical protein